VPNVTDINFAVQTAELWRARPGAFSPRSAFLGTGVSGVGGGTVGGGIVGGGIVGGGIVGGGIVGSGIVGSGTAPCVVVRQVPRVPGKAALAFPVPQSAFLAQLGHINNYNQMTSVYAVGEGASGPPPYREPA
jgi:hypothetical protein